MEMMFVGAEPMLPQAQPKQAMGKAAGKGEKSFADVLAAGQAKGSETAPSKNDEQTSEQVEAESLLDQLLGSLAGSEDSDQEILSEQQSDQLDPNTLLEAAAAVVPTVDAKEQTVAASQNELTEVQGLAENTASQSQPVVSEKPATVQENMLAQMFRTSSQAGMTPLVKQMQDKLANAPQMKGIDQASQVSQVVEQAVAGNEVGTVQDLMAGEGQVALQQQGLAVENTIPGQKSNLKADAAQSSGKSSHNFQDELSELTAVGNPEEQTDSNNSGEGDLQFQNGGQDIANALNEAKGQAQSQSQNTEFSAKIESVQHNQVAAASQASSAAEAKDTVADPATTHVRLPSGETVPEKSILDQVTGRIHLQKLDGRSQVKIDLHPEELGKVKLSMTVEDNKVQVHLQAQSQQVQEVLESHLARLRESFEQQGLKLDQVRVSVDSGQTENRGQFQEQFASSQQNRASRYHSSSYRVPAEPQVQTSTNTANSTNGGLSLRI